MKILKKFGWFIVCMLVAALSIVLQASTSVVAIFIYTFLHYEEGIAQVELAVQAGEWALGNVIYMVMGYQFVALVIFGVWYYAAYGKKKRTDYAERPGGRQIAFIVLMGLLMQIAVSGILNIIYYMAPESLEAYQDMVESAGIGEANVIAMLATVVLAPLGEEILCRGIIFRLAKHVSARFWVANTIQAFAFGVIHANLVQGIYAFAFGLVLGYIYGKYERIWICMLLHGVINFSAMGVDYFWAVFPEKIMFAALALVSVVAVAGIGFCLKMLGPIVKGKESESSHVIKSGI